MLAGRRTGRALKLGRMARTSAPGPGQWHLASGRFCVPVPPIGSCAPARAAAAGLGLAPLSLKATSFWAETGRATELGPRSRLPPCPGGRGSEGRGVWARGRPQAAGACSWAAATDGEGSPRDPCSVCLSPVARGRPAPWPVSARLALQNGVVPALASTRDSRPLGASAPPGPAVRRASSQPRRWSPAPLRPSWERLPLAGCCEDEDGLGAAKPSTPGTRTGVHPRRPPPAHSLGHTVPTEDLGDDGESTWENDGRQTAAAPQRLRPSLQLCPRPVAASQDPGVRPGPGPSLSRLSPGAWSRRAPGSRSLGPRRRGGAHRKLAAPRGARADGDPRPTPRLGPALQLCPRRGASVHRPRRSTENSSSWPQSRFPGRKGAGGGARAGRAGSAALGRDP